MTQGDIPSAEAFGALTVGWEQFGIEPVGIPSQEIFGNVGGSSDALLLVKLSMSLVQRKLLGLTVSQRRGNGCATN